MTEELIAQLGRMDPSRLGVIARTSAMQFKKTTKRADQIGSDLGVSYLLEGSVRTTGSRIRIAVQLIDARSESQLWAEQYERDAKDLLTLQREVAEAITRQITTQPGRRAFERRRRCPTPFDDRRGVRALSARALSLATGHCRRAPESEGAFSQSHRAGPFLRTRLQWPGRYLHVAGQRGFLPMSEAYPLGRAAALKALELDDMLGEAHNSLAAITADYYWDWAEAERHFKRAIELNPNYETALRFYSFYLACMGRPEEALAFAERARDLDPVSPNAQHERWRDPLLRPSLRRSHRRSFERRSISLRTSAPPMSCWDESMSPKACLIEPSRNSSAPKVSWVLAPTSSPPRLRPREGWTPARGACDARRIAAHLEATGPSALSHRATCTSASAIRIARSNGSRSRSRRGTGRWACSRSSRPSMACARIRALLHCSSASAFHDKRQECLKRAHSCPQ